MAVKRKFASWSQCQSDPSSVRLWKRASLAVSDAIRFRNIDSGRALRLWRALRPRQLQRPLVMGQRRQVALFASDRGRLRRGAGAAEPPQAAAQQAMQRFHDQSPIVALRPGRPCGRTRPAPRQAEGVASAGRRDPGPERHPAHGPRGEGRWRQLRGKRSDFAWFGVQSLHHTQETGQDAGGRGAPDVGAAVLPARRCRGSGRSCGTRLAGGAGADDAAPT